MATSGSIKGSILSGAYTLRVDWSQTQNIAANTSKVTCAMYLVQASGWRLDIYGRDDNTTTINGTTYTWESSAVTKGGGSTTKMATVTSGNIAHNSDGSKSITISATFYLRATISGTYREKITCSATINLEKIPRPTTPTLSTKSVDMGGKVTISLPRADSGFTHELSYAFAGSGYTTFASNVGTSYTWTVPDLASKIPNAISGTITILCITRDNGTPIGTKTVTMTAKVPSSVVPSISAVATAETVSGLAAQFGAFVQSKSKIKVTITAAGAKGSTIKSYSTTFQGKTYTGSSFTLAVPASSGSLSLVTTVKDSRGRTAKKTTTISVVAYAVPKISKFTAYRVDETGAAQEDGIYAMIAYSYTVSAVGNKNTASMEIEWKKSTDTSWNSTPLLTSTSLAAAANSRVTSPTFSTDYQYDIRITVSDWFGTTVTYLTTLPTGAVIMDFSADGKGLGIGKVSERPGLDFGWDIVNQIKNLNSMYGQYRTHDGLLLQWGTATITPEAANTPTTVVVTFPIPYTATPAVFTTPVSSVPQNISVSVQRAVELVTDNKKAVAITLVRNGLTATGVYWLAVGKG